MDNTKTLKIEIPEGYEIDKEKSTFENIVFKKAAVRFSKAWCEFCANNRVSAGEACLTTSSDIRHTAWESVRDYGTDKNLIPDKFAKPMLALMQLLTIREKEYTRGWEPNWGDGHTLKYIISVNSTEVRGDINRSYQHPLSFPTEELRDEFFNNWKDLIEVAKPLL